jgi:hypothetical protein
LVQIVATPGSFRVISGLFPVLLQVILSFYWLFLVVSGLFLAVLISFESILKLFQGRSGLFWGCFGATLESFGISKDHFFQFQAILGYFKALSKPFGAALA